MKHSRIFLFFLSVIFSSFFCGNANNIEENKKEKYLPVVVKNDQYKNTYTKFSYNSNNLLSKYENSISGKYREGNFQQLLKVEIEYDRNDRIKSIIKTQNFITDSLNKQPEIIKFSCSYKGSVIRIRNEASKTESLLDINENRQLVKNSSIFNKSENTTLYTYDNNGNLTGIVNTYQSPDQKLFESNTINKFDDKFSMTKDINVPQWFLILFLNIYGLNNNLSDTKYSDSMEATTSISVSFKYSYNKEGYPNSLEVIESLNSQPIKMNIEYIKVK